MRAMYALARPLLFLLDAEDAHHLALHGLHLFGALPGTIEPLQGAAPLGQPGRYMGVEFPNRLGLAAGLDKDGVAVEGLARLGFGFVEVGTITPRPQPGNPRPRMFRLPAERAIINRMGFNNQGVVRLTERLESLRRRDRLSGTRIGVNVGKNKDTPNEQAADDYCLCIERVYDYADYLTLNLSSPNTPGLRALQTGAALRGLLERVCGVRERLASGGRRVPLALKVAPDLVEADMDEVAAAIEEFDIDGLIATNTTITRPGLNPSDLSQQAGGLSGAPLAPMARAAVSGFRKRLGERVPIIGVGGVMGPGEAGALLGAGADMLQIYTGFIYAGPSLVRSLIHHGGLAGPG